MASGAETPNIAAPPAIARLGADRKVTVGRLFTPNSTAIARFGAVVASSPADRRCDARRISPIASSGPTPGPHSRDEVVDCHSACNIDPLSRGIGVQN
jgi:hypothetical protein